MYLSLPDKFISNKRVLQLIHLFTCILNSCHYEHNYKVPSLATDTTICVLLTCNDGW
jgi:hypothetical protein